MYILIKVGPNIEPWDTPEYTIVSSSLSPSTTSTNWNLSHRYVLRKYKMLFLTPKSFGICKSSVINTSTDQSLADHTFFVEEVKIVKRLVPGSGGKRNRKHVCLDSFLYVSAIFYSIFRFRHVQGEKFC